MKVAASVIACGILGYASLRNGAFGTTEWDQPTNARITHAVIPGLLRTKVLHYVDLSDVSATYYYRPLLVPEKDNIRFLHKTRGDKFVV